MKNILLAAPVSRREFLGASVGAGLLTLAQLSFPGRHDDQVDALTQGLAWGRQQWSRKIGFYRY